MYYRTLSPDWLRTFKGIREMDIHDYYLPSPLSHANCRQPVCNRTTAVPLATCRLVRRKRV
jgi:hypothetical protein